MSVVFSVIIGLFLGVISGYFGGSLDRWLVLIMDALFAFPSFLLAVVFAFLFTDIIGEGIWFIKGGVVAAALSLTVIYIPQYFRVVRNTTVSAKQDTYIEAARGLGASNGWIMRKYLFGNVIQSVPVVATLNMPPTPLVTLAGLSFLGLGIQRDRGGRLGLRPAARPRRREVRHLVDVAVSGSRDRHPDHRGHTGGRGPQRDGQPDPAQAPADARRHARSRVRRGGER